MILPSRCEVIVLNQFSQRKTKYSTSSEVIQLILLLVFAGVDGHLMVPNGLGDELLVKLLIESLQSHLFFHFQIAQDFCDYVDMAA